MRAKRLQVAVRAFVLAAACVVSGCASYYRVTDPQSGNVYHTHNVHHSRRGGFVEFKDARTGEKVTLQSSQVVKVSKYEFDKGTR